MALQISGLRADYEPLAAEYYDAKRHPTCANFREGSRTILRRWLEIRQSNLVYCEVGAGKSLLAELLAPGLARQDQMYLIDDSPAMLAHSSLWADIGAHLVFADISKLIPLATESVDVCVASLGDPYNVDGFWAEVRRIVRPGGRIFYTTPSYEWAIAFRMGARCGSHGAEFELADGQAVCVPSHIYPSQKQIEILASRGLLVDEIANVAVSAIRETPLSPKLRVLRDRDAHVVTGYALTRLK